MIPALASMTSTLPTRTTIGTALTTVANEIVKRAAKSSSSSTSSGKKSKCTGSKSHCQTPSNTNAITVGVAVGVPVGCVLVLFVFILWFVYRRNKKEAQEDNDPDFDGDIDYLPSKPSDGYPLSSLSHSANSQTPKEWEEDESYFPPFNGYQHRGHNSTRSSQQRSVDPFFLPEPNDSSLRDFAKQLHGNEFGPYRIASNTNSRTGSQVSLAFDKNPIRVSQNIGSSLSAYTSNEVNYSQTNKSEKSGSTLSSDPPFHESPVKSAAGEVTKQYIDDHSGYEVEHSRVDTTFENGSSLRKPSEISRDTFNFEMGNGMNRPDDSAQLSNLDNELNDDSDHCIIPISSKEEEDIKRMKSIYKVYLDRNGTVRQDPVNDDEDLESEKVPYEESSNISDESQNHLNAPAPSHRVASSIYSAAPPQSYQSQGAVHHTEAPNVGYGYSNYDMAAPHETGQPYGMPYQNYPPQAYANYPPQQYPAQSYALPFPQQQQFTHPQTMESINELPTPTNLPYSSSSHSLTSFKQRPKQSQLTQLQTARINGTAVNPMDHPEMFYTQGNDSYSSFQQSINGAPVNAQPAAPHQLRQSIVMTNPSELTAAPRYRPAGSIRTASAANTRNNTMTSRMNPYYQQQQAYNSRVSGLLNEEDVLQPPSVGQILPHSGSHDDLRKQIGSSHNYNIV